MTDQDSRDWIKQRMTVLRKKAGFSFNQDVFISILLCLVSGKNKHLILIAPSRRIPQVAQMATEICRGLFGFTTANVTCQQDQTVMDFVHGLFTSSYDDDERYQSNYNQQQQQQQNERKDTSGRSRRGLYSSTQQDTIYHKTSRLGNTNNNSSKDTPFNNIHTSSSPISPVDFTIHGDTGDHHHRRLNHHHHHRHQQQQRDRRISSTSTPTHHHQRLPYTEDKKNVVSSSVVGPSMNLTGTMTHRLAQTLIIQQLNHANELVQAALLELIVTKEIRMTNVRYNTPKPYFLNIVILPESGCHQTISSPLLDHFFISYHCKEESFQNSQQQQQQQPSSSSISTSSASSSSSSSAAAAMTTIANDLDVPTIMFCRRASLLRNDEIKSLAEQASKVHINIDITRYIRDIIVGIRTHPLVSGGLTARTSQDLVSVTRSLAALFRQNFLTPDLVAVAVEKVVGHRLRLQGQDKEQVTNNGEDDMMMNEQNIITDIVGEILRIVYAPV